MRDDLARMIDEVWARSDEGRRAIKFSAIYAGYEAPSDDHSFTEMNAPALASSFALGMDLASNLPLSTLDDLPDDPLQIGGLNTNAGYLWFAAHNMVDNSATERVVIHANPYPRAARLMRLICGEMLGTKARFAGVNSAKLATLPCFASGRNDTIIIYTKTHAATIAVITEIRKWINEGLVKSADFLISLPFLIRPETVGIGWSSEPPNNVVVLESYPAKLSFGKYLSQVIQIALQVFCDANMRSPLTFRMVIEKALIHAGFDLDEPHRIGQPSPVFLSSVPWPEGEGRREKPLYKRLVIDCGLKPFRSR